jgi:hypothetical protein
MCHRGALRLGDISVAVWRIIDGAKPYRFTRIGKDRRSKTGRDATIEKFSAHGQSSQIGMLFNSFWDAADAQPQIEEAIDIRPDRG